MKISNKNSLILSIIFSVFLFLAIVYAADVAPTFVTGSAIKNQSTVNSMMYVNFSSNWTDDTTLKNWTFETNQSGTLVNSTFVAFGTAASGSNISSLVLLVNGAPGANVSWRFIVHDNQTNFAATPYQYFVIIDNQPPLWIAGSIQKNQTTIYPNTQVNFTANWTDNTTLNSWTFEINKTGLWVNSTPVVFSTGNNMSSQVYLVDSNTNVNVTWRFWVNDSSNNWNVTSYDSFIVGDNTNPQWISGSIQKNQTTIYQNTLVNFTANWTDNVGLDSWIFSYNQTGTFVNSTSIAFATGLNMSSNISMITATAGTNVTWRFWVNDSSNNWNVTSDQTFIVATVATTSSDSVSSSSTMLPSYNKNSDIVSSDINTFEFKNINANEPVKALFTNQLVTMIELTTSTKVSGGVIRIETIETPNKEVIPNNGNIFAYYRITTNLNTVNSAKITFKGPIDLKTGQTVVLERFTDKWKELKTIDLGKGIYQAESPGFSTFAVVIKEKTAEVDIQPKIIESPSTTNYGYLIIMYVIIAIVIYAISYIFIKLRKNKK